MTAGGGTPLTYAGAGVDIDAGEEAVARIRSHVRSTARPEVLGGIGGFGGLFALEPGRYREPVLVSATDGVGTKIVVAEQAGRFDSVGIDLVAMCVDDLVCCGAEPLFFLDYLAVGRLDPVQAEAIVAGVAAGCRRAGCALIGGEMAEHPGVLAPGQFDLAGFAVGVVERDAIVDGSACRSGDLLVGLPSPGLRSNGYSLARRVLFDVAGLAPDDPAWSGADVTVADELLRPSEIYALAALAAIGTGGVHAIAHVTGGGLPGNLPRVLPDGLEARVDRSRWVRPRIFDVIQSLGPVAPDEMARVFNLGIGMVLVVDPAVLDEVLAATLGGGHEGVVIGELAGGSSGVVWTDR